MGKCVFCKFKYKKGSNISFHRIPTDLSMRRRWLEKMKVGFWSPKRKDSLCSKHFDVSCFIKHNNRRSLKPGSVPTIFEGIFGACKSPSTSENMTSHSPQSKQSPERLDDEINAEDSSSTADSDNDHDYKTLQTLKKSRILYSVAHDHQYESTPRSYENAVQHAKKSLQISNARIKVLTQCVRTLRNKVTSLASVIHDLRKGDLTKKYEIDVVSIL